MRAVLTLSFACLAVFTRQSVGQTIDDATWTKMINDMGRQRMFTQRMAKAFLMIAKGVDAEAAKADLVTIIGKYDVTLTALIEGTGGYAAPPSDMVASGLQTTLTAWTAYKALLNDNMDTVTPQSLAVLESLSVQNMDVLKKSNAVVGRYVDAARSFGAATAGIQVDTAGRQRMLTQKMSKEAFFIGLDFQKSANLINLDATMQLFSDSHEGLLQGVYYLGLPQTSNMCTLWQMRTVSHLWTEFQPFLRLILDDTETSIAALPEIAGRNIKLLVEMNKAVGLYTNDDGTACQEAINAIDDNAWKNLINGGGKQRMMGQKASRLFFQVASGVNTEASRVALSTTLATGGSSLRVLLEGSESMNYPAPPTQVIANTLIALWDSWQQLTLVLNENANSAVIGETIIHRVAMLSVDALTAMNEAVEMYVAEALVAKPHVNSIVINIAGRQRMYQAKMSKEALLVTLEEEPVVNLGNMETTISNFERVHWELLLGIPATDVSAGIERTTDVCILLQMKHVTDRFNSLKSLCRRIAEAGTKATMTDRLDLDAQNPVAFGTMNTAVGFYAKGQGTCDPSPAVTEEWDFVFGEIARLRQYIERATKDFLMTLQDLNSTDGDIYLPGSIAALHDSMWLVTYGSTPDSIPTPPSQAAADKLFVITDAFTNLKTLLETTEMNTVDLEDLAGQSSTVVTHASELADIYIDDAWAADTSVEGARQTACGTLPVLIERMQKQAVMLQFPECAACVAEGRRLSQTIEEFDNTYSMLKFGSAGEGVSSARRMQNRTKNEFAAIAAGALALQLESVESVWSKMKPRMTSIAADYEASGSTPSADDLIEVMDDGKSVSTVTNSAVVLFSTSSRTTTWIDLDLLTPLPLTGSWAPGRAMRTASKLAEDIINQQAKIAPGYGITHHYFDDKCDDQEGMRVVLKESVNDDYIAIGGMGCSAVCSSVAFAASSMNMPFLSYECSGGELSDTTQYADFVRMGTPLVQSIDVINALVARFKWSRITVVSGSPPTYRTEVEKLQKKLMDNDISTDYYSSYDISFDETRSMVDALRKDKRRVIYLIGEESFFRRVICASRVTGANLGITWLYDGIQSNNWWTVDDPLVLSEEPDCTGAAITESFQGALNILNLGQPLPEDADLPLDCFEGYTATTFLELMEQHLLDGYPVPGDDETMVARPHMELLAHAADGACAFAKTMGYLMGPPVSASIDELRKPSPELYRTFVDYMKNDLVFQGVSGKVNFTGNDKAEPLALKQVQGQDSIVVGYAFSSNASVSMDVNGGPSNESWQEAHPDPTTYFAYWIFQVLTPILCICCPAIAGCVRSAA